MRIGVILSMLCGLLVCTACDTTVQSFQPYIDNSGRTETVAVHPSNEKILFAASSSGGLFRTLDGGASWLHVDALPTYSVSDVEFSPDNAKILVATAVAGFATKTGGGIWRSTDGGQTWSKPSGVDPKSGPRCPARASAWSVSFEAGTQNVYAATDCGIAISRDRGASWAHTVFDSTVAANKDLTQNRQFSVQAAGGNRVWSAGQDGVWYSDNNGKKWAQSSPKNLRARGGSTHALASSPFDSKYGFMVPSGDKLYQTTDGGKTWAQTGDKIRNARPPFVRAAQSISGTTAEFDVYFGNGVDLDRKTFKVDGGQLKAVSSQWTRLNPGHSDPCDVIFHPVTGDPYLAATDGGLHKTTDKGKTWSWFGGKNTGYWALQITEVTGQLVGSSNPHFEMYFGTQDNDVHASDDGGNTWKKKLCCEGFYLRVPAKETNPSQTRITGVKCAGCVNFISESQFKNVRNWKNPPDEDNKNDVDAAPFLVRKGHYYQVAVDNDTPPYPRLINFSDNNDQNWKKKAMVNDDLYTRPQISSPSQNQTKIYHSARRSTFTPKGEKVYGLVRIEDIYSNAAKVHSAEGPGFGSIGIFTTMFAWYPVFAVNPKAPDHLMAADVQNDTIIISHDGGQKWSPDDKLANLITDNGDYLFSKGRFSLVTNITFDPERPCRILIGTRQNGVFYTVNGGHDWQKVSGSKYLYNISSFFFAGKHIYASTYGRGLFRLNLDEGQTSCLYAKPPKGGPLVDGFKVVKLDTLDESAWEGPLKSYCDECTYALATEGHVTEIEKEGNQVSRIGIVGGSFVHLAPGAEPIPLPFSVTVQKRLGEQGGDVSLQSIARGPEPIRGLILRGREIEALIVGVSPYKMEALPPARITLQADIEGGSGMYLPAGAPLTVFGSGFMPTGDGTQIRVYLDEELVKESETDEQGAFALSLTPDLHVGNYTLLVTQEGSARFVSAETDLNIVVADREE